MYISFVLTINSLNLDMPPKKGAKAQNSNPARPEKTKKNKKKKKKNENSTSTPPTNTASSSDSIWTTEPESGTIDSFNDHSEETVTGWSKRHGIVESHIDNLPTQNPGNYNSDFSDSDSDPDSEVEADSPSSGRRIKKFFRVLKLQKLWKQPKEGGDVEQDAGNATGGSGAEGGEEGDINVDARDSGNATTKSEGGGEGDTNVNSGSATGGSAAGGGAARAVSGRRRRGRRTREDSDHKPPKTGKSNRVAIYNCTEQCVVLILTDDNTETQTKSFGFSLKASPQGGGVGFKWKGDNVPLQHPQIKCLGPLDFTKFSTRTPCGTLFAFGQTTAGHYVLLFVKVFVIIIYYNPPSPLLFQSN